MWNSIVRQISRAWVWVSAEPAEASHHAPLRPRTGSVIAVASGAREMTPEARQARLRVGAFVWLLAGVGCQSAPPEVAAGTIEAPSSRATEMPESLRCKRADDCVPEPSCYWGTPACIASASAVPVKCGDDADPVDKDRPAVRCACQEGQCTPQ